MDSSSVRTARLGWLGEFSRYQWSVFLIAWIGWALDATAFEEIDRIIHDTIKDPVGPEFMAPPARSRPTANTLRTSDDTTRAHAIRG